MALWGFANRQDAVTLKQVARERRSKSQFRHGVGTAYDTWDSPTGNFALPARKIPALRAYICVPIETIPGATFVLDDSVPTLCLGSGRARLYRRNRQSGTGPCLRKQLTEDNVHVEVTVYNPCPDPVVPVFGGSQSGDIESTETVMFCTEDMWGDLYIVRVCTLEPSESESGSASESSTVCINKLGNTVLSDIPIYDGSPELSHVLGIDADGCLVRVPVGDCVLLSSGSGS